MKKIGITGSRKGLSEKQKLAFMESLNGLGMVESHHGDCVGVDENIGLFSIWKKKIFM